MKHQRAAYAKAVDEAIEQLEARAIHAGKHHEPSLRVAEHGGAVYLDLAGQTGQAVEITGNGWQITNDPPVRFVRPANMRALPMPSGDGDINDLRPFINVANEDDFRLIVACLVGYLRPSGPYPIVVLNGEQGSAKTTLTRVIRRLIDPNETDIRSPRSNERDLAAAGRNNWVLAYDNLSASTVYGG